MQLSDKQYQLLVFGVAIAGMLLVTRMRYCGDFNLPGKPGKPIVKVKSARAVTKSITLSSGAYRAYIAQDAKTFGIPKPRLAQMTAVFPYHADRERRVLAPGDSTDVLGMRLTLSVEKLAGSSYRHMFLTIENLGHTPLAYRIQTRPSSGKSACSRMHQVAHNSLALGAGGKIHRAECVYRKGRTLEVQIVETIELPELGYLYLSSMDAQNFALDPRTAKGHQPPVRAMSCRIQQAASLRNAIDSGAVTWRNQAEFYARHRCKSYPFPVTYQAFQEDGEQTLPVGASDP